MVDGTLLCEQEGNTLVRIAENPGSPPDTVFVFYPRGLYWVHGLPGEQAALAVTGPGGEERSGSFLHLVDLQADTASVLLEGVLRAWYVPTGHVVWVSPDGAVFATPFDLDRLEMSDTHEPLFEGVRTTPSVADMVLGDDGTVVFVQGSGTSGGYELVWVDREGREEAIGGGWVGEIYSPRLAPGETQMALEVFVDGASDVWVIDISRESPHRVTLNGGYNPTWTPDGLSVTFTSNRTGRPRLWTKRADGSGEAELLRGQHRDFWEAVWSPDSAWLISATDPASGGLGDIVAWQIGVDTIAEPLVATQYAEMSPAISPNHRYLAYVSNYSGELEVYVSPFPNVRDGRDQVSIGGGFAPVWASSGQELFYRKYSTNALVAVDVITEDSLRIGEEHALFPASRFLSVLSRRQYDVTSDGQQFVMLRRRFDTGTLPEPRMIQVLNWFTELEERVGR
jgi:serine/threonine-protein kinase